MTVLGGNIIRVTCNMERDGTEDQKNVWHVKHSGTVPIDTPTFIAAVAAKMDAIYQFLKSEMTTDLEYIDLDFYNVSLDFNMGNVAWPTQTFGLEAGEELPYQVSALCTFRTATTQHPGKKYFGGYTETTNEGDGVLTAGAIAQLVLLIAEVFTPLLIGGEVIEFGNYNYALTRWAVWVSGAVDLLWSTQRRRKAGVGS